MSIFAEIAIRSSAGEIVELEPCGPSDRHRQVFLTAELYEELTKEQVSERFEQRYAQLQADLEVFITRPQLSPEYLFSLTPWEFGVWEIRSLFEPQIRVFGLFLAKDMFLATHFEMRRDLGGIFKRTWKSEMAKAKDTFCRIFPGHEPLISNDANQLITGAMDEQYFA
jgi:hypothetical protein